MKRFQFSLETLLSLRRGKEQECEIALANAVGELTRIDQKIFEACELGESAFRSSAQSLDELMARERLWMKSIKDQKKLSTSREEAAKQVHQTRQEYNKAHAQKKALDNLRENRLEQWKNKVKRKEIQNLDEGAKRVLQQRLQVGGKK